MDAPGILEVKLRIIMSNVISSTQVAKHLELLASPWSPPAWMKDLSLQTSAMTGGHAAHGHRWQVAA